MSMAIISDVHVKEKNEEAYRLLLNFLRHKKTVNADEIFLLGDIFEFMCGQHNQYYNEFSEYFNIIIDFIKNGKKVHYFEGNHDFHLKNLYINYFKLNNVYTNDISNFKLHKNGVLLERYGKKYMFSHGDDIFFGGILYPVYKSLVKSFPVGKVVDIIPGELFDKIGEIASNLSKKVRQKKNLDYSQVRINFREKISKLVFKKGYDVIILGHVHIQDSFIFINEEKGPKSHYLNNGYAMETHSFIHISNDGQTEFVRL